MDINITIRDSIQVAIPAIYTVDRVAIGLSKIMSFLNCRHNKRRFPGENAMVNTTGVQKVFGTFEDGVDVCSTIAEAIYGRTTRPWAVPRLDSSRYLKTAH